MPSASALGSWALVVLVTVLAFGLLVVVHELGHFAAARLCGMRVERFSVGFGPVIWRRLRGATEWCVSAVPFGGYVRIAGMAPGEAIEPGDRSAYANQPAWRRFAVILTGPAMNYVSAVLLAVVLVLAYGLPRNDPTATIGRLQPAGPAERAGLQPGDRILSLDGERLAGWRDLVAAVLARPGRRVELEVQRGEGVVRTTATLDDNQGSGRIGLEPRLLFVRLGPGEAVAAAFRETNAKAVEILAGLGQVVSRKQKAELRGPIGIAQEMARSAQAGAAPFLRMVWFISVVLALFNLLPLPALDGGRLVFLGYEIVTRRRVNEKVESYVHLAGALALFALILAITVFGDLARILGR